jgi:DNA-binding response OmpR family regulator
MSNSPTTPLTEVSNRPRVLVIDDDPQIRNLLVAFLRRDYLVAVASEGEEGFQKALEHQPDVAVIDIQMDGWDGLKTLKAFREHATLKSVRTVMLTADTSRQTVMAAIAIGADDYIVKPALSRDDLLQKLLRVRNLPTINRAAPGSRPDAAAKTPETANPASAQGAAVPANSVAAVAAPPQPASDIEQRQLQEILDAWE